MLKRNKRILVVASFLLLLTPATMASANRPGATCKTVGQITTVKIKKKSTDLVCTQVGKRKLWQVRATGIPGGTTGQPGVTPGGTTTAKPGEAPGGAATTSDCDKPQYKATSTGVNNIIGCDHTTTYSELAVTSDRKSTRLNSSHIPLSRMPSSA